MTPDMLVDGVEARHAAVAWMAPPSSRRFDNARGSWPFRSQRPEERWSRLAFHRRGGR